MQKALSLKDGEALGVYNLGVFEALYEKVTGQYNQNNRKDLDNITGT